MKKAREYQIEADETVMLELLENDQKDQLLVMATGLGKTFSASTIRQKFQRCLWLTHKEELIDQSALALLGETIGYQYHKAINELGGYLPFLDGINKGRHFGLIPHDMAVLLHKQVGVVKAQRMDKNSHTVVASVQTMVNRLDYFEPDEFDLIIADEAHYALAKGWMKVLNHFRPQLRLGLTATPYRLDGACLSTMFGKITFERDLKFGIDNGWLAEIDAIRIKTDLNLDKVARMGGEFKTGELERMVNTPERNRLIVSKYKEFSEGKKALVFAVDVKHCIDLCQTFISGGIRATFVVGDEELCPNRRERFAGFKGDEYEVLVNVDIATTGFDFDMVETLIMGRPTMSLSLYMQMIGRGTRTERGVIDGLETVEERLEAIKNSRKPNLLVLDITDNTSRHSLINTTTLDGDKEPEEKMFTTKEKKEEMIREARVRKLRHVQKEDQRVDLLRLPKIKIYKTGRLLDEASEKQLAVLEREGYEVKNTYWTKYDATMIISNFPAAEWQLKKLRALNYDLSKGCTLAQYAQIMKDQMATPTSSAPKTVLLKLPFTGLQ